MDYTHTGLLSLMANQEPVYGRPSAVPGMGRQKTTTGRAKYLRARSPKLTEPVTMILPDAAPRCTTIKYTQGDSVTLTRPEAEWWWRGMVSGLNGRTVPGLIWESPGQERMVLPGFRYNSLIARWPMLARAPRRTIVLDSITSPTMLGS